MKGRKPKPAEVKRRDGNPGKRPLAPSARIGRPDVPAAPEYLPEQAAEVWNEIVPELAEVGLVRSVDIPALEALCTHVAIARAALDTLTTAGRIDMDLLVTTTEKGTPVVAPEHRIYRDSWREALRIAEHYGLTPISRTRLGIAALQERSLAEELRDVLDDDVVDADVVEDSAPKAIPAKTGNRQKAE